ncbi:DPP IV N-terminal domain-containing protein [Xanthocytophaga agilis]|uniref:DPP IV N-terminal domain-containing protein n=1 Tax=Xanthocytophaga agilis TaxID=3048010 RepID=A0AAE3R7H9_9BACT|nr:DPP IV N-terminal domain-containing protein [Xanthocytophaga agilis]MDJ1505169.1 DPP IV N-terminal domain-containing protein [Xanthocytophaga agilis]
MKEQTPLASVPKGQYKYDAFVYYAKQDQAWVKGYLLDALKNAQISYCIEDDLPKGMPQIVLIEEAIKDSERVILVLSKAYQADFHNQFVSLLTQSYDLLTEQWRIIPIHLDPVSLPISLSMLKGLEASKHEDWEEVALQIVQTFERKIANKIPNLVCPYPGMRPFSEKQSAYFFGRENEINVLCHRLEHQHRLFIIGSSGSGKSSLIDAGLLPKLNSKRQKWEVKKLRIGEKTAQEWKISIENAIAEYRFLTATTNRSQDTKLVLVIDQFEELFSFPKQDRSELHKFLQSQPKEITRLVFVMRADYYADLMYSDFWPIDSSERLEITPLRESNLRIAVERPSKKIGVYIDAVLIERLINDAANEPGILPLIQETMRLLWDRRVRQLIPLHTYESLGRNNRSGLAEALAIIADSTYANLSHSQKLIARRIFLRLVQFNEGRSHTRRQQKKQSLQNTIESIEDFNKCIDQLSNNRLLTLSGDDKNETVDLSHEILIVAWPKYQQWTLEAKESEQTRRGLEDKADEWYRRKERGEEASLLDEVELKEAERWIASSDAMELGTSPKIMALINASKQAVDTLKRVKKNRRKILTMIVSVALIGLSILAFIANDNAKKAQQQLATTYWSMADKARSENELIKYSYLIGSALENNQDDGYAKFLLTDIHLALTTNVISSQILSDKYIDNAVFSQDGSKLLFWDRAMDGDLWLYDIASKTTIKVSNKMIRDAVFSQDGSKLLFWDRAMDGDLWLYDIASKTTIKVSGKDIYTAVFSPDGSKIVFSTGIDGLWLYDIASKATIQISNKMIRDAVFSQDGSKLLFWAEGMKGGLWLYDVASKTNIQISGKNKFRPSISKDGSKLLFWAGAGVGGMWLYDIASKTTIKVSDKVIYDAVFSPDGSKIAFADNDGLWLYDIASKTTIKVSGKDIYTAVFSQDGSKIAFWAGDGGMWLYDVVRKNTIQISGKDIYTAVFSPDGSKIVFSAGIDGLWLYDIASKATTLSNKVIHNAVLTKDGSKLLFWAGAGVGGMWLYDVVRENTIQVSDKAIYGALFTKDGSKIAFWAGDGGMWLYDVVRKNTIQISGKDIYTAVFSPDGSKIVFSTGIDGLWLYDVASKTTIKVSGKDIYTAVFSPDGNKLLFRDNKGVWLYDVVRENTIQVSDKVIEKVVSTKDGSKIAFWAEGMKVGMWLYDIASKTTIKVSDKVIYDAVFSPDGSKIAFADNDGLWLYDIASKTTIKVSDKNKFRYSFSQDGSKIVFSTGIDGLWLYDVASKTTIKVSGKDIYTAVFSQDGSKIVFSTGIDGLWLYDVTNKATNQISDKAIYGTFFTKDGSKLLWWGANDGLQLYDMNVDLDLPSDLLLKQIEVFSGTTFNLTDQEIHTLSFNEWDKKKQEYEKMAKEHYKACKYPKSNVWRQNHLQEAEIVRSNIQ